MLSDTSYEVVQPSVSLSYGSISKDYATLQEAIDDASEGVTVTLLKDVSVNTAVTINKSLTLDLGEHTLTSTANGIEVSGADVTVNIKNGTVNSKNDSVDAYNGATVNIESGSYTSTASGSNGIVAYKSATVNIKNATVEAQEFAVLVYDHSTAVITNGDYTSYDNAVVGTNGTNDTTHGDWGGNTITINGGTFNGNIKTAGYVACGVYVANNDKVAINGGTFNINGGVGVAIRAGQTTIGENVTFNFTAGRDGGWVGDNKKCVAFRYCYSC
jgi:hypothetical protein